MRKKRHRTFKYISYQSMKNNTPAKSKPLISFLEGARSVFNLAPIVDVPHFHSKKRDDTASLAADWQAVGAYLEDAITDFHNEQTSARK